MVFWWPDAQPSREHRDSLAELASAVASLGHPSCLVAVNIVEDTPDIKPTLVPRVDGSEALRIPTPGRLDSLHDAYVANRRPEVGAWAMYGRPKPDSGIAGGHHRDLIIFRLISERSPLPLEAASRIIAGWRKAILSKADQPLPEAISGHAPDSSPDAPKPSTRAHLALVPIADVGHRYARSHLLALAAALPDSFSAEERTACLRALGRVESLALGDLGVWRVARCDASETRKTLLPEVWCKPSSIWASVTPVVFGKYPGDLWGEEAAAMIREACAIAGLPAPSEVTTAPVAWVLGTPPAFRFPALPSRPGKPRRAHVHARVVFPNRVAGPLLVGAGRHQGYGLFRQLSESPE